jgi:phosphoribosyl-dephospho-CoA transferase
MTRSSDFLAARDGRQQEIDRILGQAKPDDAASFLVISANVPGCDKHRPGISRLLRGALDSLQQAIGLKVLFTRSDLLGPFHVAFSNLPPIDAKRAALLIEAESPSARLLDVDV